MNKLDNRFKDGLEDFTSLPSPGVWDAIEASLNDSSKGVKQTVYPHWRWISGAVASIALALFVRSANSFTIKFLIARLQSAGSSQAFT